MEKNNLIMLGLLGALGVGAYLYFNNQDPITGGSGAPGGARPGSELGSPTYIFNIDAPVFPDFMSFFTETGTNTTTTTESKKDSPLIINQADYKPGSLIIVPIKNTIPSTTGGQNFPTVIPIKTTYKPPMAAPAAQPPLKIQNIFGFPVVPHLAATAPASKKAIVVPASGYQAALITAGTPEQQIEQYSIAPRVIKSNGAYKKVM